MAEPLDLNRLRGEFDKGFASLQPPRPPRPQALLALRVAGAAFALRLSEIGGLLGRRRVRRLPSPRSDLLGLIGLRGQLCPVYDPGPLLGLGVQSAAPWLLLAGTSSPLALAFESFEGQFELDPQALLPPPPGAGALHCGAVAAPGGLRPLLDLGAVLQALHPPAIPSSGGSPP